MLYNGNALEQSLVKSQIEAALAQANIAFSEQIQRAASQAIGALLSGRNLGLLGAPDLIGLGQIPAKLAGVIARNPPGADRAALEQIASFARFASQNLGLAKNVLSTIGQPIQVKTTLISGRRTPLNTFAVVVAVSVSLMFVCVLLASGGLALEREEHTLARLVRGLTSRSRLLVEKALLAAACSFVLAFGMLAGIGAFVSLDWSRVGLWLAALAAGAAGFAALGVAIGALAREVRAASLLAFLLSLPLAFLALVPSGAVGSGLSDVISVVSFVFPFKAALQALDAAVNGASPSIGLPLAHLVGLALCSARSRGWVCARQTARRAGPPSAQACTAGRERSNLGADGLSTDADAQAACIGFAARAGARDRALAGTAGAADVRHRGHRRSRADRVDAGRRAPVAGGRGAGGERGGGAWSLCRDAVRRSRREGRARVGRLG